MVVSRIPGIPVWNSIQMRDGEAALSCKRIWLDAFWVSLPSTDEQVFSVR